MCLRPGWDPAVAVGDLVRQERHCEPGGHKGNEPRDGHPNEHFHVIFTYFHGVLGDV